VSLQPGVGSTPSATGVTISDASGESRLNVVGDGSVALTSADGADLSVTAGQKLTVAGSELTMASDAGVQVNIGSEGNKEFRINVEGASSTGGTVFRVQSHRMFSHVPAQMVEITEPADSTIKKDIEFVNTDKLLQRLQEIEVKKYRYTDEWQRVRGLKESDVGVGEQVRGVIAQQVYEKFPEYVHVTENFELPDKNFKREKFHEVNKIRIAIDLLGAMQAQHKRLNIVLTHQVLVVI
jgi:hypothetical protein